MESLMDENISKPELKVELPPEDQSFSVIEIQKSTAEPASKFLKIFQERDSVMLGEISPHHDYDSKSLTETPPSYNQLNYNENIQRC
jgi:period circadian protein 2